MGNFGYLSAKDEIAVENLLSQAKDLYVLEQVAAINCSGFTDSSLSTDLETRFRRLKSLPVSRPDPVYSSSAKKLISQSNSKSFCGYSSSASACSGGGNWRNPAVKYRPLDAPVEVKQIFPGIKRNSSVNSCFGKNSRIGIGSDFSDSGIIGSSSCRISSSSFTSIDLASPRSDINLREEGSNRKSKSKFSISWFNKLKPSKAIGCLWSSPSKSSTNIKKAKKRRGDKELSADEGMEKANKFSKNRTGF